jgi:hypothetical protein
MTSWKIAAWIALSASAGLLGTGCIGDMQKTVETLVTEIASVTTGVLEGASEGASVAPLHRRRANLERSRCHNRCIDRFNQCGRGHVCRKERTRCMNRCRRF